MRVKRSRSIRDQAVSPALVCAPAGLLALAAWACSPTVASESSSSTGTGPWVNPCCGGYPAGDHKVVYFDAGIDAALPDGDACGLPFDVCQAACGYVDTCYALDGGDSHVYCAGCASP
jgi:hypothetical protein